MLCERFRSTEVRGQASRTLAEPLVLDLRTRVMLPPTSWDWYGCSRSVGARSDRLPPLDRQRLSKMSMVTRTAARSLSAARSQARRNARCLSSLAGSSNSPTLSLVAKQTPRSSLERHQHQQRALSSRRADKIDTDRVRQSTSLLHLSRPSPPYWLALFGQARASPPSPPCILLPCCW